MKLSAKSERGGTTTGKDHPSLTTISFSGNKREVFSWALFDFANTAFYVLILVISYPLYFKEIVVQDDQNSDFLWGITFSISMSLVALISPILGAAADRGVSKKKFLATFTLLCILATAMLFMVEAGAIAFGMLLLILANIGFEAGLVFYDSFLPDLTSQKHYGRISGFGFAMGYVGSLVTLLVSLPLLSGGFAVENLGNIRLSFLLAAGMFLLFALPLFFFVRERSGRHPFTLSIVTAGYRQVAQTIKEISRYKNIGRFLLSYFIYFDAINTIIIFSSIFARESLHMEMTEIIFFFALVQTSAIAGSLLFGILADTFGQKRTLNLTLLLWLAVVIAAFFVTSKIPFFGIGIAAGIAMGSSQSTSRSLMSVIVPPVKRTEFFGFYSTFGKASAILGPVLFGYISSMINQRAAILSIGFLLLIGIILLRPVIEQPYTEELHA
ncbi:MAG: MFS transporter [Bacteroidetes bacterium]|nr:MAG: MFS transporter [Bacteroidota bacterium]